MFAISKLGNGAAGLLAALWLAAMLACATSSRPGAVTTATEMGTLGGVQVESVADGTLVTLTGLHRPVFTDFQQDDPARVVVDLALVEPGSVPATLSVYDGTLAEVRVHGFDDDAGHTATRVELALDTTAGYDVTAHEDRLEIRVRRDDVEETIGEAGALESATLEGGADAEVAPAEAERTDEAEATEEEFETAAMPTTPATALLGVETRVEGETTSVVLRTDGLLDSHTHFLLEGPPRLVIDLPGLVSRVEAPQMEVWEAGIARVRIGQHDDKVRVVLDGEDDAEALLSAMVELAPEGMRVALGAGAAATEPMALAESADLPAAPQPENEGMADPSEVALDSAGTEEADAETAPEEPRADTTAAAEAAPETVEPAEAATGMPPVAMAAEEPTMESAAESDATAQAEAPEVAAEETGNATETAAEEVEDVTETAMAEPAAADGRAAAAEPGAPARATHQVYGVQFDAQADRDRVVVLSDGETRFTLARPDAETLIVRLHDATIDPEAAVHIAPEEPGAVSLVTAFEEPEAAEAEVRVVIQRAAGLEPEVGQSDGMIFLDFARTAQAAQVPAMETPEAAVAGAATKALAQAAAETMPVAPPAAIAPEGEAIELLKEGGLVSGKQYTGRRISLDFKDVEIEDVLRLIAEVSDLNIIAGEEVSGQVTIRLVDVPWDQALDVILLTKGLGFVRVGNVLRIAPGELLKAEEEARLQERRAKEKLEDLVVKLQPVNYADVQDVEKMVTRLLTPRGSVDVDERTNTIILKDIASVIDEATALIKAIDTQTPQVLIEAKIVEANLDFSRELGAQWAFGVQPYSDAFDDGSSPRRNERLGLGNDFLIDTTSLNNVVVSNPITSIPTGLVNFGAFLLDERFNVNVQLEAAESHGEGKVISSPRVVTLDNRKASIEQGVSIPFQTFENGDAKLEFIDAVLKLEVTPHITADESIIMKIEVERNAPDDSVQTPTGSPAIAKNEALTETLVKDGQTLVIGGIYTVEKAERESRVPYFHKIPVLGNAFRNNEKRDIRKELLVFVTPRIVVAPEVGS